MPADKPHQENPHTKKHSGPAAEQKGYSTSEAIIELRDSLVGESHTNREQQNRQPKRKPTLIEIATLVLLFLTTAGLAVQDIILNSSDTTFKATLTNQKESNERQLRAYVGVTPGDIDDFGVKGKWRVRFARKNFGQTPAYDVGFSEVGFAIIKRGEPVPAPGGCIFHPENKGLITLFPTSDLPWTLNIGERNTTTGPDLLDPTQIALVTKGERQFVYWGNVCYNDVFGKPHYTNYCWMYSGGSMTAKDAEGCYGHNDSN